MTTLDAAEVEAFAALARQLYLNEDRGAIAQLIDCLNHHVSGRWIIYQRNQMSRCYEIFFYNDAMICFHPVQKEMQPLSTRGV